MNCSRFLWLALSAMLVAGCASRQAVWQTGPTIGLLNGVYDGIVEVSQIRKHGDQGVGLWDKANGEGLIIDDVFYQVTVDGKVHVKTDADKMPWAMVAEYSPERVLELPAGTTLENIGDFLDGKLPTVNTFFGLRLEGEFSFVQSRSVPEQSKPYPPFSEVEKHEVRFNFQDIPGTMVGFRSPPYVTNMSVPNYHLHFLNQTRTSGGHVLAFVTKDVRLYIDRIDHFEMSIPVSREFEDANLNHIIR